MSRAEGEFWPISCKNGLSVRFGSNDSGTPICSLNWHNCDHMNIQLGYALLRDRRVPIRPKLIALAIGAAIVWFTELLQIPLESLFAVILPIVGIAGDVVLDGV